MSTNQEEPTLQEFVSRLAELEQANARLQEELVALRTEQATVREQVMTPTPGARRELVQADKQATGTGTRKSRRRLLAKGLGVATAAIGGAAALQMSSGVAYADNVGVFDSSNASVPAVSATGTKGAKGVEASSDSFIGVHGSSNSSYGVLGSSLNNDGVHGESNSGYGVSGTSTLHGVHGSSDLNVGVFGESKSGNGVGGLSVSGYGVSGFSTSGFGVHASSIDNCGVFASSISCYGVHAITGNITPTTPNNLIGVFAEGGSNIGVFGTSDNNGIGVAGSVLGSSSIAVGGRSDSGAGVFGQSTTGQAGAFQGDVNVTGTLSKGGGSFQIDHPLDPAHKYLFHSFVESPDMKNIYDGVAVLDAQGEAEVTLPTWFDALNTTFRYQLTAIGTSAPELYIAQKVQGNQFKIAGGKTGMEVCWQVTGIRQDAWANAHRIPVEQDKLADEQGYYLHPELYGASEQQSVMQARYPGLKKLALPKK